MRMLYWSTREGGDQGVEVSTAVITALVAVVVRACVLCCAGQRERVKVERRRSMQEVGGGAMVVSSSLSLLCVHTVVVDMRGWRSRLERWRLMREGGSRLEQWWSLHSSPSSCGCTDTVN